MKRLEAPFPRYALTPPEAAASIGCGQTHFEENVAPALRVIRSGRKRLIPVTELERWVAEHSESPLVDQLHTEEDQ